MNRKIISQGNGAYTITLPKQWVEKHHMHQLKEVEIKENSNSLILSPKSDSSIQEFNEVKKKTQLSFTKLHSKETFRSIIGSLYRFGYDEIEITVLDNSFFQVLEDSIHSLFGLELFIENDTKCIIRSIYTQENTKIKLHIQRMIYSIIKMQEIIQSELIINTKSNFENDSNSNNKQLISDFRNNVLKQRDLILRIITKQHLQEESIFPFYTIALCLWSICRNYYHLYLQLEDFSVITEEVLSHYELVSSYFKQSFEILSSFSQEDLLNNYAIYSELFTTLSAHLTHSKLHSFCLNIVIEIQLAQSSLFILNISR